MKYLSPKCYDKNIVTKKDKVLGYIYFIDKDHPLASKGGKVYYHRHVYSKKVNKWIDSSYIVHHIDGNRDNNDPNNLEAMSNKSHVMYHYKERGYNIRKVRKCKCCDKKFISIGKREFCSLSCASSFNHKGLKGIITKEELSYLVWSIPTAHIAKMLGCSDVSIGKLCKKYKINKPPRGYWVKIKYNIK